MRRLHGLLLAALLCALAPSSTFAATGGTTPSSGGGGATCGANQRLTTANDAVVKNGTLKVGVCYNPNDAGVSQGAAEAKAYLDSLPKKPLSNCAPPTRESINHLNDSFAVCAAEFLRAYTGKYGSIYITSAYRGKPGDSFNPGGNACAGGSPTSNHMDGLAMDLHPSDHNYQQIWKFAQDNPQFGVCFPYLGSDKPHMALAGTGTGEAGKCAQQGIRAVCSGTKFDPASVKYAPAISSNPYGQSQPLGYGQQVANSAQGPCPNGYVFYSNQCYALQSNQPLGAAQQPFQQYPQQQNMGQAGMPQSAAPQTYGNTYNSNTNPFNTGTWTSTSTGTSTTTRLDLVEAIINGTTTGSTRNTGSAANTGTSSTFTSDSMHSVATIWSGIPASDTLLNTSVTLATNTLSYEQLTTSENTFGTAEIGTAADYTATSTGRMRAALENMRRWLVYLLQVLRLLRREAPVQEIQQLPLPQLLPLNDPNTLPQADGWY